MSSLYLLIPIAVILVFVAIVIFIWAVRHDQFEDLERRGYDILLDDDPTPPKQNSTSTCNTTKPPR